jgi:hypothetical protein
MHPSPVKRSHSEIAEMRCHLHYQEYRLTEWGRRAGLLAPEGKLNQRLNEKLVHQLLAELEVLLTDTDKMKKRYGIEVKIDLEMQSKLEVQHDYATPALGILSPLISKETRSDILLRGKRIQSRKNPFPKF